MMLVMEISRKYTKKNLHNKNVIYIFVEQFDIR